MQIFEITQRQPVNEINYGATTAARVPAAVSRGAAIGTGFAGALGNAITNAPLKALGARTGADLTPDADAGKQRAAISDRMDQAVQAAMPAITQQADQQWRMWSASTADMLKKTGVNNISEIDPQQLREPLMTQVETIASKYGIRNYRNLPNFIDPEAFGGAAKYEALDTVKAIDAAIAAILDPKQQVGTKARDNWVNLTKELYSAGLQLKFREEDNKFTARDLAADTSALDRTAQRAQQSGLTADQLGVRPGVVRATGDKAADAALQALGFLPRATVQSTQPVTAESKNKRSK
jgi:hypothetical protein